MGQPHVSMVIPHLRGWEILERCLRSLQKCTYSNKEVLVVDNASTDGSIDRAQQTFPWIRVFKNSTNLGYAGGCNRGIREARGDYILLLNNDTECDPQSVTRLVAACEADARIAACQPKILSMHDPQKFDYAGAAGGLLDVFGYPFARGRLFFTLERDTHQYDDGGDIFWASGTATLLRKSALDQVGYLDEAFFAHMEEIDLDWRLHLAGYRVVAVPAAVVYHAGGSTLSPEAPFKLYLNHRNSLVMLIKNYAWPNLLWVMPVRFLLEAVTICCAVAKGKMTRGWSAMRALFYVASHLPSILVRRRRAQQVRKVPDRQILSRLYRGSIVFAYFIRGIRTAGALDDR